MFELILTPNQLDLQSKIVINRWLDVDSAECREIDDNYSLTKKMIKMLHETEPKYLFTDTLGRLWGKGEDGYCYPFHFNYGKELVGYRISRKASN